MQIARRRPGGASALVVVVRRATSGHECGAARAIAALDGLLPAGDVVNMTTMACDGDRGVWQTCPILKVQR